MKQNINIEEISLALEDAKLKVERLRELLNKLNSNSSSIEKEANQLNMINLNAAIEAARSANTKKERIKKVDTIKTLGLEINRVEKKVDGENSLIKRELMEFKEIGTKIVEGLSMLLQGEQTDVDGKGNEMSLSSLREDANSKLAEIDEVEGKMHSILQKMIMLSVNISVCAISLTKDEAGAEETFRSKIPEVDKASNVILQTISELQGLFDNLSGVINNLDNALDQAKLKFSMDTTDTTNVKVKRLGKQY